MVLEPLTCKDEPLPARRDALHLVNLRLDLCNAVAIPHVNDDAFSPRDPNKDVEAPLQVELNASVIRNDLVVLEDLF